MTDATEIRLTFPQLALLDWLFERDRKRFFTHSHQSGSTNEVRLFEVTGVDADGKKTVVCAYPSGSSDDDAAILDRLGGRATIQTFQMYQAKFFSAARSAGSGGSYQKFISQFSRDLWHWSETIYLPADTARTWWKETGREQFLKEASKRIEQRSAVERLVVVGVTARIKPQISRELAARIPNGMALPIPSRTASRPQAIARVVKETATRLYVTDVTPLRNFASYEEGSAVQGRRPNLYVPRENVLVDPADMRIGRKLAEIDAEHAEDLNRIAEQTMEAILPALLDYESRLAQKDAEREDMVREAIEAFEAQPKP